MAIFLTMIEAVYFGLKLFVGVEMPELGKPCKAYSSYPLDNHCTEDMLIWDGG